jgi:hypothetical protein
VGEEVEVGVYFMVLRVLFNGALVILHLLLNPTKIMLGEVFVAHLVNALITPNINFVRVL